jgi:hypothetical protein
MVAKSITEDLRKRAGNMILTNVEAEIEQMSKNLVSTGYGQSMLAKGDRVVAVDGMVAVTSQIRGQKDPVKYLALVIKTDKGVDKITSFASLMRRKPNATTNHGIFAEPQFETAVNYKDVADKLAANPNFVVADVERNVQFPGFTASVYTTSR